MFKFTTMLLVLSFNTWGFQCPVESGFTIKSTVMTDEEGNDRIWNIDDRFDLTYCVSDRFKELKPLMVSALKDATSDWMDSANISFRYIPQADATCDKRSGPSTRFRIALNSSRRYPYAARAFFPYDERRTITFKKSYLQKGYPELLRLTLHELGHVLGLRHEHIRPDNPMSESCREASPFRGITAYDRGSIMHYSRCGGTGTLELSELDRQGVALLYP